MSVMLSANWSAVERMSSGRMKNVSELLLTLQGDGDYDGARILTAEKGVIRAQLQSDLDRLTNAGIPVDIVFRQGISEVGLN